MVHRSRGSSGARPLSSAVERRASVEGALLYSVPGPAIVVGLAIKLPVWLVRLVLGAVPAFLTVVDRLAGLAVAAGLTYFLFTHLGPKPVPAPARARCGFSRRAAWWSDSRSTSRLALEAPCG